MFRRKEQRKIDFIVAGAQKAGTTALYKYLKEHPDIGMGHKKELHFFDNEQNFAKRKINYAKYTRSFDFSTQKKVYGEITPIYMHWEPSCLKYEYNQDIKLIFILRNPVDRAFSNWNMEYDRNNESKDFSYCIRNEEVRIKEALPFQHRIFSYINRGYYYEQIRRTKRYFNDEQLLFVKYEQFVKHQEKIIYTIFDFLGVDAKKFTYKPILSHKRQLHTKMSAEDKKFLIDKFYYDMLQVEKELNWDCSDWFE